MENKKRLGVTMTLMIIWSLSCVTLFPNTAKETAAFPVTENAISPTTTAEIISSKFTGKILYVKGDYIYSINANGTNDMQLVMGSSPVWSSDGNTIAYLSKPDTDLQYDIYLMNADGTNQRPLLPVHPEYELPKEIDWQPNGNLIVFSAYSETDKAEWDGEIFAVNAANGDTLQITRNHPDDWNPTWHPNGKEILYLSPVLNEATQNYDDKIHIMNSDGTNSRQFFTPDGRDIHPIFSPNGGLIAFTYAQTNGSSNGAIFGLFVIDSDGSNERLVFESPSHISAIWSPNGEYILISTKRDGDFTQLFIVEVEGGKETYLADGYGTDWKP